MSSIEMFNDEETFWITIILFIILANIELVILRILLFVLVIFYIALLCYDLYKKGVDGNVTEASQDCIKYVCKCSHIEISNQNLLQERLDVSIKKLNTKKIKQKNKNALDGTPPPQKKNEQIKKIALDGATSVGTCSSFALHIEKLNNRGPHIIWGGGR